MPYSTRNGLRIHYEVHGDGPPLVLIHANPFDRRLWMFQVARFSAFYRVIAVDLRGYGLSDKPNTPFTLADMKNDVLGVCADEGITRAIHDLGLAETTRIEADMAVQARNAGFDADVAGYRRFLATDAQFIAADANNLRERVEILCKRIDAKIPAYFRRIPRITYGVDVAPAAMSANLPPAYAQPAPSGGNNAGIFWVNGLPEKCPTYILPAMAMHEAWPGHLMHIGMMAELEHLPAFRRNGAIKYTACVEGWALYCEQLGIEFGVYTTPHEHFGRLEMEMWRACRLVVDTGIHAFNWSRAQAIAFLSDRLSLSPETIAAEVDRYIALPGQALAYHIGGIRVRAMRGRAEAALGDAFDLRHFHEIFMSAGPATLPVLDQVIDAWIAEAA